MFYLLDGLERKDSIVPSVSNFFDLLPSLGANSGDRKRRLT